MSLRVAGTDPGTSSLDVLVLQDGAVGEQCRFSPEQLRATPAEPVRWLEQRGPFALVAAPSGYGLPLVRAQQATPREKWLLSLVRPDDGGAGGVSGFSRLVEAFCASSLPAVFLPGVVHLDTVAAHRKINRIDLGTADKLCVAALALYLRSLERRIALAECSCCLVELGSAFTACVVIDRGRIVDGVGGSAGAPGWRSQGSWDGEVSYLLGPLAKGDLFSGGVGCLSASWPRARILAEGILRVVAGLLAVHDVPEIVLSGRLLETDKECAGVVTTTLQRLRPVVRLGSLPGAWVKQAAQGSALLASGLAGGKEALLTDQLELKGAKGSVLDGIIHPGRARLSFVPA